MRRHRRALRAQRNRRRQQEHEREDDSTGHRHFGQQRHIRLEILYRMGHAWRMALDTVFLDAGGVLLFPNWSRVSDTLARHGVHVSAEELGLADYPARRRLDVGDTVGATTDAGRAWLYFDLVLAEAGIPLSEATRAALQDLNAYHRERNLWEHVPDEVVPALEALRARGLRLTVVSNANGTLCAHLERLGLASRFHCVLDSYDLGVEKPDPRLFEIALERSGAAPRHHDPRRRPLSRRRRRRPRRRPARRAAGRRGPVRRGGLPARAVAGGAGRGDRRGGILRQKTENRRQEIGARTLSSREP